MLQDCNGRKYTDSQGRSRQINYSFTLTSLEKMEEFEICDIESDIANHKWQK